MSSDYQPTFEDLFRADMIASLPGRTAFLDESGSYSSTFTDKNSKYYVVCAVIVDNNKVAAISKATDEIRIKRFGNTEMKSSNIGSNHERRIKVLTDLLPLDFHCFFLIVDKEALIEGSPLIEYKTSFIKYLHKMLYENMYLSFPKLRIIEDEHGGSEFQSDYKRYVESNRPEPNLYNDYDFCFVKSENEACVQIADILAGSVHQHLMDSKAPNVFSLFKSKIVDTLYFPKESNQFYRVHSGLPEEDKIIHSISMQQIEQFISNNKDNQDESIIIQVLFLKMLKFNLSIGSNDYIYSQEIVKYLSNLTGKNIKKEYLYRKIIEPLRDKGIIIASCSKGYKIPTSLADISAYIHQTTSIVGPMLNRIDICRKFIKKGSPIEIDVFDDPSLEAYKRYFGEY